jgi:hypothetical protein
MDLMTNKEEKKPCKSKIKDGNPFIKSTRQMRTQVDTTQRKKKTKAINQQKSDKNLMQRGFFAMK